MLVVLFTLTMIFGILYFLYKKNYEFSRVIGAVYLIFLIVLVVMHPEHTKTFSFADRILGAVSNSYVGVVLGKVALAIGPLYDAKPITVLITLLPQDYEHRAIIIFLLSFMVASLGALVLPRRPKRMFLPLSLVCFALSLIVFIYPFLMALNYTGQ